MKITPPHLKRGLLALAVAGALGFGASQAVATPATQVDRSCNPICKPDCQGFGGQLQGWTCLCCG